MVTDKAFRALADPTRRALLDRLQAGGQPVHELARHFPVSRPAISKHLRLLREAGLVVERPAGREVFYELNAEQLKDVDDWLASYRRFWQTRLVRLKEHVERKQIQRGVTEDGGRRTAGRAKRTARTGGEA